MSLRITGTDFSYYLDMLKGKIIQEMTAIMISRPTRIQEGVKVRVTANIPNICNVGDMGTIDEIDGGMAQVTFDKPQDRNTYPLRFIEKENGPIEIVGVEHVAYFPAFMTTPIENRMYESILWDTNGLKIGGYDSETQSQFAFSGQELHTLPADTLNKILKVLREVSGLRCT